MDRVKARFMALAGLKSLLKRVTEQVAQPEFNQQVDGRLIVDVHMSQIGFTCASDEKPVLATAGCYTCIGVAVYDRTNKVGCVMHIAQPGEIEKFGKDMLEQLRSLLTKKLEGPLEVYLCGGVKGMLSEITVAAIKKWISDSDIPMVIVSEDILMEKPAVWHPGKNVLIDTRTGKISEYDPLKNPHKKTIGLEALVRYLSGDFTPKLTCVYMPAK